MVTIILVFMLLLIVVCFDFWPLSNISGYPHLSVFPRSELLRTDGVGLSCSCLFVFVTGWANK